LRPFDRGAYRSLHAGMEEPFPFFGYIQPIHILDLPLRPWFFDHFVCLRLFMRSRLASSLAISAITL
jgi:hypothetical protein